MTTASSIRITGVRIRNFRCLRAVTANLGPHTLLIGENNSGKTSFARALHAAIGTGQRAIEPSDVFILPTERSAPKGRAITIDLLIQPINASGEISEQFDSGGPWVAHFGSAIQQDEKHDDRDQVIIRTEYRWNHEIGEYTLSRSFLKEWPSESAGDERQDSVRGEGLRNRHIAPLALSYLDANRDIATEIRSSGSNWRKLLSDLGLTEETATALEESLKKINESVIAESDVLGHLEEHLNRLFRTIATGGSSIKIAPVQTQIRDLIRGVDALMATHGGPSFPLASQGMGTRSLAALLTFQALTEWRQKRSSSEALHPFLVIEEPEAHLQPQAQRALLSELLSVSGQLIVTTHSPYICSQAGIESYRVFFKEKGASNVREFLEFANLGHEEQRKLRRQVLNTRGDILFSRAIVLVEGETEEQAIPNIAEHDFGTHPATLGLTTVGVGGSGNIPIFVRLAKTFGIPWHVLVDGEDNTISALDAALERIGEPESSNNPRVFVLPDGTDFEGYVAANCPRDKMLSLIVNHRGVNEHHRADVRSEWIEKIDDREAIAEELRSAKTAYGAKIAFVFSSTTMPEVIRDLLAGVKADLNIQDTTSGD